MCRPTNLSGKPNVPRSFKIITERARRIWPWVFYLSEREGFEPSVRFNPYTHFPGVLFKPLRHLSRLKATRLNQLGLNCKTPLTSCKATSEFPHTNPLIFLNPLNWYFHRCDEYFHCEDRAQQFQRQLLQ